MHIYDRLSAMINNYIIRKSIFNLKRENLDNLYVFKKKIKTSPNSFNLQKERKSS